MAVRHNSISSDEDDSSDNEDADPDSDIKNISANLSRNVAITNNEEASASSKKSAVQNSVLPEVCYNGINTSISMSSWYWQIFTNPLLTDFCLLCR